MIHLNTDKLIPLSHVPDTGPYHQWQKYSPNIP